MKDLTRLREFTKHCRPDMHEPDEQGISAEFGPTIIAWRVSNKGSVSYFHPPLDNACTQEPASDAGVSDLGFWLVSEDGKREWFNLANIIALARRADSDLGL